MIEVADVFRRFAARLPLGSRRVDAALTSARRRGHPQLPHRGTWRPGLALRAMRYRDVLPGTPVPTAVARSATPHKPRSGSNAAGQRCCRCHHFHVTITVPAELREVLRAHQRDGYARADAGQCRGDHRTRPRSPLCRRHRGRARRAAHVDSAVEPAPTRSLPGQRQRYIRGRRHLASGTPEVSGSHQGSRQIGARQIPGPPAPKVSRSRHPGGRVE